MKLSLLSCSKRGSRLPSKYAMVSIAKALSCAIEDKFSPALKM